MEPESIIDHFPWTTSMMVFVIDKDGRILLKQNNECCGTYRLDTTGEVNIRKMVCDELYTRDILTCPENLQPQGILNNDGRNVFIYTVTDFITNSPVPSMDSLWYSKSEIPFEKLSVFEKYVLTMLLDGEKIGFEL